MNTKNIVDAIKDILFPVYCLKCNQEGSFVCDDCMKTLDCLGVFYCPICHATAIDGKVCDSCDSALDRHIAIMIYHEHSLIGDILHTFKYSYAEDVKDVLHLLIGRFFSQYMLDVDMIVSVPLHKKRYVERGFNQSQVIAQSVAAITEKSLENIVIRTRHTTQQAKLNREERLKNVANAFALKQHVDISGKRIMLVDDVLTTGTTMGECAKVLKDAGAREVIGFTIARG